MKFISDFFSRFLNLPKNLKLVVLASFLVMFGYGIYNATYYNFITNVINIEPEQLGILESFREIPGLLMVFFGLLTSRLPDRTTGIISTFIGAVGFAAYMSVNGVHSLILWTFTWSIGMHIWFTLQSALMLSFAPNGKHGKYAGFSSSITAIAQVCGMALVALVGVKLPYMWWYFFVAVFMILAAIILMFVPVTVGEINRTPLAFKKKFKHYYILTFLEGCRKQVFITFAVYVLTKEFSTPVKIIALLMSINNVVNIFGYPMIGKLADKIGERIILQISYFMLIFVYLGYAFAKDVRILYAMYLLDNIFYFSTICLTTYVKKLSDENELLTALSTGQTFNHLAACIVPLIGGFAWYKFGYSFTFLGGIVIMIFSVYYAKNIPKKIA